MNLSHAAEVLRRGLACKMQNRKLLIYQWMFQLAQLALHTYYFMLDSGITRFFDTWLN